MTFRENMAESHSHWKCMANGHIRYQSDSEYDEHFLFLFKQSIARRTGPGATILAHLSGGVDSTSIVCISDHLRRSANPNPQLIDTLSFYDDSEPNWNEKPFFAIVEAERGKSGIHFPISSMNRTFETPEPSQGKCFFPGADSGLLNQESTLQELLACGHYNVVLSGIGGDELLGGVPNPLPELTDHLLSGDLGLFLNDALAWSLTGRKPLARMLLDTIKFAAGLYLRPQVDNGRIPPWITPHLRSHCVELTPSLDLHKNRLGVPPTALCNSLTWSSIMETLPHSYSSNSSRREFRYPYLDRDLVDFLFSVPSDQLVRPGRRRYLMRRALKDIVPIEILERRRKAFIIRGPLASLQQSRAKINGLFSKSLVAERGLIDPKQFNVAFDAMTIGGDAKWMTSILRTISFELWLRGLQAHAPEVASNKLHGDQIAR
jgi:asparagine synthase (glutamine-hydrolysing)